MKQIRIAALGDSLTKGVVLTERNRYSVLEQNFIDMIGRGMDVRIENYGKFGCTVAFADRVIERHGDDIAAADYTLLEYGGNDCDFDWKSIADSPSGDHRPKTILDSFRKQFLCLIYKVKEIGSRPVIISLPPILSDEYFSFFSRSMNDQQKDNVMKWLGGNVGIISRWHESYNRVLFDIAAETGTRIIDITSPFNEYEGDIKTLYCLDGIHPNAHGHRIIADKILNDRLK